LRRILSPLFSEGQETGAIRQRPKMRVKKFVGRGRSRPLKIFFVFVENNLLTHFIRFQLQNNAPYALKLHLK
jgi:hypothetical protein